MNIHDLVDFLKNYDGESIRIMEVCGSHTAAITKSGLKSIISPKIQLISGPGCPVCVTPSAYIDRLIELSKTENTCIVTFGDLMRVPGSKSSLNLEKGNGANVKMVYSPMDIIKMAEDNPDINYVFAAVGFETTIPVYTLLLENLISKDIKNVKLLTALKTMPEAIEYLIQAGAKIDGFIAPGHVSVITGKNAFYGLASTYNIPFGITGFNPSELVIGIYGITKMICEKEKLKEKNIVPLKNFYTSVVRDEGNDTALNLMKKYLQPYDAVWRGMGEIKGSGLKIKDEYSFFDAGSEGLSEDIKLNKGCSCDKVLTGKITPHECPLFKKVCTPLTPQGACMVSEEGCCFQTFLSEPQ